MKRSKAHNVYLSQQSLDILIALKTCAGNSRYLLPSRYDADAPMSRATFNRITSAIALRAKQDGLPLAPFTVHDLRRTGSTLLNEWGSTVTGLKSIWPTKKAAHPVAFTTKQSMNSIAAICCKSGLILFMLGSLARTTSQPCTAINANARLK